MRSSDKNLKVMKYCFNLFICFVLKIAMHFKVGIINHSGKSMMEMETIFKSALLYSSLQRG